MSPGSLKTPGVFIVEENAFPNSVVEVATAVPAFVGWTQRADNRGKSLHLKPWRITSMAEFEACFGGTATAEHVRFELTPLADGAPVVPQPQLPLAYQDAEVLQLGKSPFQLKQSAGKFWLHAALRLFFANGGADCYVVSAGTYGSKVEASALAAGVQALQSEAEPTLLVVPEAVLLLQEECLVLQRQMLEHCGQVMKNRVALLDIWEGYRPSTEHGDPVAAWRAGIGKQHLSFGAAYHPWLNTQRMGTLRELSYAHLEPGPSQDALIAAIEAEAASPASRTAAVLLAEAHKIKTAATEADRAWAHKALTVMSAVYKALLDAMAGRLCLLPPSAAMAGVYTLVDTHRGVWQAPANVSLGDVVSPALAISQQEQEGLNSSTDGKSINAIRSFVGEGTLVWGARTLDANSLDWRYVNVRRTMIMLEGSIRLGLKAYVDAPNAEDTWVTIRSMISNFLTGIWRRGGLAGALPDDAFSVQLGPGQTMTPEDLAAGTLRVTVLVAIVRPAEFIEITFEQKQTSAA